MLKAIAATVLVGILMCCVSSKKQVSIGDIDTTNVVSLITIAEHADFTPEAEYYLGRGVAARILAEYPVYQSDYATSYVNLVGQALAIWSEMPETFGGYHFLILDSNELNTFSAPGGFIFVTRGLLQLSTSETMVACVLSYSISHVVMHSGVAAIRDSRWRTAVVAAGHDAAQKELDDKTLNKIDEISMALMMAELNIRQVLSADRMALTILERAGYDPRVYLDLLNLMSGAVSQSPASSRPRFPTWEKRIVAVENELREKKAYRPSALLENQATRFREMLGSIRE
jgi:predicted Zn-dependent protease